MKLAVASWSFRRPFLITERNGSPHWSSGPPTPQYASASPELKNHAVELPSTHPHPDTRDLMP